jgi:2',3'-cyclic-nucleotide 2'-phosphodiesterase (5'-nucleotidase family)
MKGNLVLYIIILIFATACGPSHFAPIQLSSYNYGMDGTRQGEQKDMINFLKPFSDSVNGSMNAVLGTLEVQLTKGLPDYSLGNFMCDAYLEMSAEKFGQRVDVALMNVGGIRLNTMEPGAITIGKIYELMPFDNLMILLEITGEQLQASMNNVASRGGWPVSGASYMVKDKMAANLMVGGQPVVPNKKYVLAVSDYVANGGDDSNALKGIPQMNIGYLQRDAIIEYVKKHRKIGKPAGIRMIRKEN